MSTTPVILQPNQSLPPRLRAGDSHAWTVETQLPVGSALFFVLTGVINNVPTRLTLGSPGVPVDGNGVAAFNVTSAQTAAWHPGKYQWVAFALDAGTPPQRTQVAVGTVWIEADPAGLNPIDPRSYNEKLFDQIKAVLLGSALDDVLMYKIGGRELTRMPRMDLEKWAGLVEARVRRERIRRGEFVPTKTIGITFGGR